MLLPNCLIAESANISEDARIVPSERGTKIVIGENTHIFEFVVIRAVGGSGDVIIGDNCYINACSVLYSGNGIAMGKYVLVGPCTVIAPANHAFERRDEFIRHQGFMPSKGGVVIEDDVWIGANCVILDGAYIRRGAIVAAGSVVNNEVPEYAIVAGTPAEVVSMRPENRDK